MDVHNGRDSAPSDYLISLMKIQFLIKQSGMIKMLTKNRRTENPHKHGVLFLIPKKLLTKFLELLD